MNYLHGGRIQDRTSLDFSANINPFGMPKRVRQACHHAIEHSEYYPDPAHASLLHAISKYESIDMARISVGNGAAELIDTVFRTLQPHRIMIPVPSFYEYERAGMASGAELSFTDHYFDSIGSFDQSKSRDFDSVETWNNIDLVILAHPNNPDGKLISENERISLINRCKESDIWLFVDESFLDFATIPGQSPDPMRGGLSFRQYFPQYDKIILLKSYTKLYAMPGIRLGYILTSSKKLCEALQNYVQPWNISAIAEAAGIAALSEREYLQRSIRSIHAQRAWLMQELTACGLHPYPSDANFILFEGPKQLYEKLYQDGIVIRNCENFKGLHSGYFRIAVRTEKENRRLIEAVRKESLSLIKSSGKE